MKELIDNKELVIALEELEKEKGIKKDYVIEAIETALVTAYKRNFDAAENVNNSINDLLDEADYIKEQYFLEVSSPGIERILRKDKHLEANIGVLVEIKMFKAIDGQKVLQGILKEFSKDSILLELEDKDLEISRKDISVIKTVYEW